MQDRERAKHHEFLPSLPCHARLVLALESAILSHCASNPRLEAAVEECVADLTAQRLTEEQIVSTMTELVDGVASAAWSRAPSSEAKALAATVAEWSAAACRRLAS
ncbi:MAG TPA: hypothetical protein VFS44_04050 [Gemmatimonadaceae bacterium]|nr:hypothetical protein [Gemmatimonadaceae bacterium]